MIYDQLVLAKNKSVPTNKHSMENQPPDRWQNSLPTLHSAPPSIPLAFPSPGNQPPMRSVTVIDH